MIILYVGIASSRYGPHRFLQYYLPITAVLFCVPALLDFKEFHTHWAIIIAGVCAILPLSNFGPLQALVVHVVPPSRVGEAMGSLAACKNVVSFIAPFVMGAVAE